MVGFKGHLGFKQYMPAKPTKWGMKVWTVCDAVSGYCVGFDFYTGKNGRRNPGKPLSYEVVDYLCEPHYGKGHHVYFDRFFNGVEIAKHLLSHDTYCCGTIMTNRKGLPQAMNKKLKKGDVKQLQQGNLVATSFHDKRPVHLLSSNRPMGVAEDRRPLPLVDYNMFMGGVDKFDQQLSYYPVGRPGKKWWRYAIWHLINGAIYNAFVLWSKSEHEYDVNKHYDHLAFRVDVAEALRNGFTGRKLPGRRATTQAIVAPESLDVHKVVRIVGRRKVCVLCLRDGKKTEKGYAMQSSYKCSFCDVVLCKKFCFHEYHARELYSKVYGQYCPGLHCVALQDKQS
ncbi:piggyBac transposable element-derived protein 4-like [Aplysia californica]|uniref:PiggyBac transposable element-derived protein 4-like n=1 Tax=Aplysia californica TaxID=6500 RepID=A0ABM1VXI1_APLCA|nr:piggyBac transposable element-derived protein 4-like [Aplysia californica]